MSIDSWRVLFLSTGNAARGPMAEALLNAKGSEIFKAKSAGWAPLPAVDPETVALLGRHGLETASLHTKSWDCFQEMPASLAPNVIVTLSEEARQNCMPWPSRPIFVHWPIDDPLAALRADVREWKFRKVYSILDQRIASLVKSRTCLSRDELLVQMKALSMVVA